MLLTVLGHPELTRNPQKHDPGALICHGLTALEGPMLLRRGQDQSFQEIKVIFKVGFKEPLEDLPTAFPAVSWDISSPRFLSCF